MSRLSILSLIGVAVFAACSSGDRPATFEAPSHVEPCDPDDMRRERRIWHADPAFDDEERAQVSGAAADLFAFSSGHIDYLVAFDLDTLRTREPMILRVESWMREVRGEEEAQGTALVGYQRSNPDRVVIVVDRARRTADGIRRITIHELAHAADFGWPDCDAPRTVCRHAADPSALMAPVFWGQSWGEQDTLMCRASCLCP